MKSWISLKILVFALCFAQPMVGAEGEQKTAKAKGFPVKINVKRDLTTAQIEAGADESDVYGADFIQLNAKDVISQETYAELLTANWQQKLPTVITRFMTFNAELEQNLYRYMPLASGYASFYDSPSNWKNRYKIKDKDPFTNMPLVGKIRFYAILSDAEMADFFLYIANEDILNKRPSSTSPLVDLRILDVFKKLLLFEEDMQKAGWDYQKNMERLTIVPRSAEEKISYTMEILLGLFQILIDPSLVKLDKKTYEAAALYYLETLIAFMKEKKQTSVQQLSGIKETELRDTWGVYDRRIDLVYGAVDLKQINSLYEALKAKVGVAAPAKKPTPSTPGKTPGVQLPVAPAKKPALKPTPTEPKATQPTGQLSELQKAFEKKKQMAGQATGPQPARPQPTPGPGPGPSTPTPPQVPTTDQDKKILAVWQKVYDVLNKNITKRYMRDMPIADQQLLDDLVAVEASAVSADLLDFLLAYIPRYWTLVGDWTEQNARQSRGLYLNTINAVAPLLFGTGSLTEAQRVQIRDAAGFIGFNLISPAARSSMEHILSKKQILPQGGTPAPTPSQPARPQPTSGPGPGASATTPGPVIGGVEMPRFAWLMDDHTTTELWNQMVALLRKHKNKVDFHAWVATQAGKAEYDKTTDIQRAAPEPLKSFLEPFWTQWEKLPSNGPARTTFVDTMNAIAPGLFGSGTLDQATMKKLQGIINTQFSDQALRQQAEKALSRRLVP